MANAAYKPIDIHSAPTTVTWPVAIPPLTAEEATRAVRRLYRWAMGQTFDGVVKLTSGNRRAFRMAWEGNKRALHVNPEQGWRDLVHDMSHWLDYAMNGKTGHNKYHARFEAGMIREVVARGYLEGKLKDAPKVVVQMIDPKIAEREKKLASIETRLVLWERKRSRAVNALAKLAKQKRMLVKALAK